MSRFRRIPAVCFALVTSLAAQDRAGISGAVTDPTGSLVEGARAELVSATGLHRQSDTGREGIYQFPALPIGTYAMTISKTGFAPLSIRDIRVSVGESRTLDVILQVGSATERIEVAATTEVLNRTSAEVGQVIEAKQIREIPISGRNWATLMILAPGAVNYGDGGQRAIRFNGHSLDDSNFSFDGVDASGVQEQTQKSDTRLNIALDAIAEFRVSTAVYTAESGAAGGAQVNVVSKTGSNELHGSGFYAVRNDALDARSPFDGSTIPPFSLHQFGGSFGGPVVKNKAFFFTNYEGLRQNLSRTYINFVPNAAYRALVLKKTPALEAILNAYPAGQTPVASADPCLVGGFRLACTDQVTRVASDTVREDAGLFRFDYRLSDQTSTFFRYNIDNAYIDLPTDALGGHNVSPTVPTNIVAQFQHVFNAGTIDEAKFGINRANHRSFGYGTAPVSVSVSPFDSVSNTSLDTEVGTTFSWINNLTLYRGRHTLKAGAEIRRIRLNNSGNTLTTSSLTYDNPDDFVNNKASGATYLQGEGVVGNRRTFYMGYAQDELKASSYLTVNLGLRYEFYSVTHEILNRSAVVDIAGCGGYCPKGTAYYDPNVKNFGPRIGMAWAPAAFHGKTTVRSGFGIYYGGNQNDDFSDPAESAVPRYSLKQSDFPALGFPLVAFVDPKNQLFAPKAIDRHRKDLYYENWDFVIQQQLPKDFVAQIGYVGGSGHHLFTRYTINLLDPVTGKRPLAAFSSFGLKANDGNNNFNALQASLQRRFVRGLLLQANYAWAHGITDSSIGSGESVAFQNQSCRACDRSSSSVDVRHTLTMNGVYQLPFGQGKQFLNGKGFASQLLGGWELAGIGTARSGLPVNITVTRKATALPDGNTSGQRPDYVSGQPVNSATRTINSWFNKDAFATPKNFTWGNLGRFAGRGPGNYEIDGSLQKRFRITERLGLNFRAAAFNLLNHPLYKTPSGNTSSSAFGRITGVLNTGAVGTGAPRRIEFMLRADF
jgi:hypothetical protein